MNASDRINHLRLTGVEIVESHEEHDADCAAEWEEEERSANIKRPLLGCPTCLMCGGPIAYCRCSD